MLVREWGKCIHSNLRQPTTSLMILIILNRNHHFTNQNLLTKLQLLQMWPVIIFLQSLTLTEFFNLMKQENIVMEDITLCWTWCNTVFFISFSNLGFLYLQLTGKWTEEDLTDQIQTCILTLRSHRRRRECQSGRKSFIFNVSQRRAPARAARCVLDGEGVEESWNQVNFMVISYDAVRRQPIGM